MMPESVSFFVPGVPQPGGSKKGFAVKTRGGGVRIAIVEDAKHNAPWRAVVALAATEHFDAPLTGPLTVSFSFAMPRPGHHFGTGRNAGKVKPNAPLGHTSKPDVTKLIRSTEDALKGIAWVDDCQIVSQAAGKLYTNDRRPGCWISVSPFRGDLPALSTGGDANAVQVDTSGLGPPPMTTGTPEASLPETSGALLQPPLFGGTDGQSE